jgi:hypothetical protein
MDPAVPAVHVADDADAASGGRPDREVCAGDSRDSLQVRTEFFVSVEVAAFADEVQIEIGRKNGNA